MCSERERFEAWAAEWPRLWFLGRYDDDPRTIVNRGEYKDGHVEAAWEAWQAACPEGWQCVPVEPTDEMTKAGTWSGNGDVSVSEEWARKTVYGRMLSAAPKPEE